MAISHKGLVTPPNIGDRFSHARAVVTNGASKQAKETGEDGIDMIERGIGLATLDEALPVIKAVAGVADVAILVGLRARP